MPSQQQEQITKLTKLFNEKFHGIKLYKSQSLNLDEYNNPINFHKFSTAEDDME